MAGPAIYRTYLAAARRLDLSNESSGYWELHITEDERHGRQMVEDVALPLVDRCARVLGIVITDLSNVHASLNAGLMLSTWVLRLPDIIILLHLAESMQAGPCNMSVGVV